VEALHMKIEQEKNADPVTSRLSIFAVHYYLNVV